MVPAACRGVAERDGGGLWIVPTLLVTLTLYSVLAGQLVEFQIADS
jgi:hypothetical protein